MMFLNRLTTGNSSLRPVQMFRCKCCKVGIGVSQSFKVDAVEVKSCNQWVKWRMRCQLSYGINDEDSPSSGPMKISLTREKYSTVQMNNRHAQRCGSQETSIKLRSKKGVHISERAGVQGARPLRVFRHPSKHSSRQSPVRAALRRQGIDREYPHSQKRG